VFSEFAYFSVRHRKCDFLSINQGFQMQVLSKNLILLQMGDVSVQENCSK